MACGPYVNAVAACAIGACGMVCNAGFADCNLMDSDGCEASLDATTSCGTCGHVCPVPSNGTATCSSGTCGVMCNAGFMPSGTSCVPMATTVTFPSTSSTVVRISPSSSTSLGSIGTTQFYGSGDYITQTFGGRTLNVTGLDLNFQMIDSTSPCASTPTLTWRVLLNGTQVGTYSFPVGTFMSPRTITQSYTFAAIAPASGNQFTIGLVSTTAVCAGQGSWMWVAGGTATMR